MVHPTDPTVRARVLVEPNERTEEAVLCLRSSVSGMLHSHILRVLLYCKTWQKTEEIRSLDPAIVIQLISNVDLDRFHALIARGEKQHIPITESSVIRQSVTV